MHFDSVPPGATVTLPSGERLVTPGEAELVYYPFGGAQRVTVEAPGYRTIEANLRRSAMPPLGLRYMTDPIINPAVSSGKAPHGGVTFQMVPEHGAAGSWTAEEQGI